METKLQVFKTKSYICQHCFSPYQQPTFLLPASQQGGRRSITSNMISLIEHHHICCLNLDMALRLIEAVNEIPACCSLSNKSCAPVVRAGWLQCSCSLLHSRAFPLSVHVLSLSVCEGSALGAGIYIDGNSESICQPMKGLCHISPSCSFTPLR